MWPCGVPQCILDKNNLGTECLSSRRGPHPLLKPEDHGAPLQRVQSLNPLLQASQFSKVLSEETCSLSFLIRAVYFSLSIFSYPKSGVLRHDLGVTEMSDRG